MEQIVHHDIVVPRSIEVISAAIKGQEAEVYIRILSFWIRSQRDCPPKSGHGSRAVIFMKQIFSLKARLTNEREERSQFRSIFGCLKNS